MAIPPIISNNPLLKLFRTEQKAGGKEQTPVQGQTPQDIVEISEAAQQRLDGIKTLSAKNPAEIEQAAQDTRDILQGDESLTLGLDPAAY